MKSSSAVRDASFAAVWAPWLAAPVFALLPLGGCGLASLARPAAAQASTARDVASSGHIPSGDRVESVQRSGDGRRGERRTLEEHWATAALATRLSPSPSR